MALKASDDGTMPDPPAFLGHPPWVRRLPPPTCPLSSSVRVWSSSLGLLGGSLPAGPGLAPLLSCASLLSFLLLLLAPVHFAPHTVLIGWPAMVPQGGFPFKISPCGATPGPLSKKVGSAVPPLQRRLSRHPASL